ncbi:ABSCISIC ACID-INSENSITIVE 5-like protein 5 [Sesamum angolense]|uniref:ABSCISIC ACID-INSENSITIVE 5-like protein 5 n=1 Tax=Sesamum angolense TaxID=2727404 RepID=A0AAE1T3Q4_9LAMI|nr:ABSCISIC ACID-INSENSITIVE 5-like protein 5 [Sesamum angolense]
MGSNLNFRSFGNNPPADGGGGGRPPGSFPLVRQSSVYSLTFEEFQNTVGGSGKDFGSMNMDELLKSIWSAEESQNIGATYGNAGQEGNGYLQRQGSLTLPRTLSQKTVDEVWRDMSKEYGGGKDSSGSMSGFGVPQRQPTLGEVTLEEFLVRAGVVREEAQLASKPNNVGFFGDSSNAVSTSSLGFGNQQHEASRNSGLVSGRFPESNNQVAMQSAGNLPLNINGVRSAAQHLENHSMQQEQLKQQQILPKQSALAYGAPMGIPSSGQLGSPRIMGGIVGISDPAMHNSMLHNAALQGGGLGMVGLGANVVVGSPASDGLTKSNGDTSSVSPVPYVFNGGLRGRKSAVLEKVVERRQRRMIKNRESAARSRARKQVKQRGCLKFRMRLSPIIDPMYLPGLLITSGPVGS